MMSLANKRSYSDMIGMLEILNLTSIAAIIVLL